ncbi:6-phosphogluconate dehydrogenase [Hanstruepera ponticola]|uniref:6-phosphogluconate dehydrogenase n=1 Tax=Hanstruepera ponticola TaxID=2042995 RepID=UPI000CF018B0|nr:6-phosphogluconate dehydrogenase [Hanstruepera ponticola]
MKKFFLKVLGGIIVLFIAYVAFLYFASYSEGIRAGRLVKFSHKGVIIKTWEGEISQGVSDAQIFVFSVEDKEKQVISDLQQFQGKFVKLHYFERFGKLFWLGDTKYFVTKVEEDNTINQYLND